MPTLLQRAKNLQKSRIVNRRSIEFIVVNNEEELNCIVDEENKIKIIYRLYETKLDNI